MIFLPLAIAFGLVALTHLLVNLGVGVPVWIMEPIVQVWILMAGTVIMFGVWMRQIFMMLAILSISFIMVVAYYGLYMVG